MKDNGKVSALTVNVFVCHENIENNEFQVILLY
jgi:hypothetical protein